MIPSERELMDDNLEAGRTPIERLAALVRQVDEALEVAAFDYNADGFPKMEITMEKARLNLRRLVGEWPGRPTLDARIRSVHLEDTLIFDYTKRRALLAALEPLGKAEDEEDAARVK